MNNLQNRLNKIYEKLIEVYPDAECTLNFTTPEKFLFSNILSPQCTDSTVNYVVKNLWSIYDSIESLSKADINQVKKIIEPCGMQNVKAKRLILAANKLIDDYGGILPTEIIELQKFKGIGRKTSLVIASECFGKTEGVVVDTHNLRIAMRIGFLKKKDPEVLEQILMKNISKSRWRMWSHLMVFHGRKVCFARNPNCDSCTLLDMCKYGISRK